MTKEQKQVKSWMAAYRQATPESPCIPDAKTRILRAKLIYEEAVKELCSALGVGIYVQDQDGEWDCIQDFDVEFRDWWCDRESKSDLDKLKEIADGCEDLKVVTEGTLVACGLVVEQEGEKTISQRCDEKGEPEGPSYIHYVGFDDPHFNEVMRSNWTKFWTEEEVIKEFPCPDDYSKTHHLDWSVKMVATAKYPRLYRVKDKDGKVIKSPSYSPPNFKI